MAQEEIIFEKIQAIIEDKLSISKEKIKLESTFRGDLKADSLDAYEIIYSIEEEFNIKIPDEEANSLEKVADIVAFVKTNAKES